MAITHRRSPAPSFADRIRAAVDDYAQAPDREERDRQYLAKLRQEIHAYEERYGVPSSEIHDRIESGALVETEDVVRWIFAVNKLARAEAT